MKNIDATIMSVHHAALRRHGDSAYKSVCPACGDGILAVSLHPETFLMLKEDICRSCGQQYEYLDIDRMRQADSDSDGRRFEVALFYRGRNTYIIEEAEDEDDAIEIAVTRWAEEDDMGVQTGAEWEDTEEVRALEMCPRCDQTWRQEDYDGGRCVQIVGGHPCGYMIVGIPPQEKKVPEKQVDWKEVRKEHSPDIEFYNGHYIHCRAAHWDARILWKSVESLGAVAWLQQKSFIRCIRTDCGVRLGEGKNWGDECGNH